LVNSFFPGRAEGVDVCFLLSMCMWLKNWKEIIDFAALKAPHLLFESNGSVQQQKDQHRYLKSKYHTVTLVNKASNDDPGVKERKLYFCKR